jgi:hypothetical protein
MKLESYGRKTPKIKAFEKKLVLAVCRGECEVCAQFHDEQVNVPWKEKKKKGILRCCAFKWISIYFQYYLSF